MSAKGSPKLWVAADHAGVELKAALKKLLPELPWEDLGPSNRDRVDYPDYAEKLTSHLDVSSPHSLGLLICGSGIGMCIAANKAAGIRAAVVENPIAARLAREHNAANVLCLGARFLAPEYASEIVLAWWESQPSHEGRHQARIEKIAALEEGVSS